MIILPGLIDPHVHLRTPGQTDKEDFLSGTSAALNGGFTTLLDMPNNAIPITTRERLEEKKTIARKQIVCDIGFHFLSMGDNFSEFEKVTPSVTGLKVFLNLSTGGFIITDDVLEGIMEKWTPDLPILIHAEENTLAQALKILRRVKRKIHICHTSSQFELEEILKAKEEGLPVTCGVTPHHLFLTEEDAVRLGSYGQMKPPLKSKKDRRFIWNHLNDIDIIESDHAPHTRKEKKSDRPPFGVPNLDTTLPLLLTAVAENKLEIKDIIRLCHAMPAKIFDLPTDIGTKVEVDEDEEWVLTEKDLKTKCNWSPFTGQKMRGRVKRVFIRGEKVFENGTIIVQPGFGKILKD